MGELEGATSAYERALNFNPNSIPAMVAISCILRSKDQFPAAVEYLQAILRIDNASGETWSSLGGYNSKSFISALADSSLKVIVTS